MARIVAGDADRAAWAPAEWLWMYQQMILIRRFEETLLDLKDRELIHGPVHTSIGQEATAVGAASAIRPSDKFAGTHRAHHQYLAKALNACREPGFDPVKTGLTDAMQDHVRVLLLEVMGLADGCSGGRGGSMHLYHAGIGVAGTNAIVGGGVPNATGTAWADALQGKDCVTLCFFGDGALYQGTIHESCNLASLWQAPILYVIENNAYAVGTSCVEACSADPLCAVAAGYNMPAFRVDGMDAAAVRVAVEYILARRKRLLPAFLQVDTYRHCHHAGRAPGSAFGYRDKEEEAQWRERDPLAVCERWLRRRRLLSRKRRDALEQNARECVRRAVDYVLATDGNGSVSVRAERWPAPETLFSGLRDENAASIGCFVEAGDVPCTREIRYSDAIAEVTGRWLEKDERALVLGEEVANMGGGAYGATKGLAERYPGRVLNTPISESGFCGLACGAALNGMHPIVELMFSSFGLVAADQLFNQIGQLGHIYGGNVSVPLVVRTRVAAGLGYGAQHSMDPVALFALFPGWRIFVPTTPFDYVGLFNAAMKLRSPTLVVEHHVFYGQKGGIPDGPPDHVVAPGKAKVLQEGDAVSVAAYGRGVALAMAAARELEAEDIAAEVMDLRTVDDAGMDYETIGASLRKTGMLVTVEEAPGCNSIGAKIVTQCAQRFFDYLDGPAVRVHGADVPLPVSRRMEGLCLPGTADVVAAIRRAARRES